MKILLLHQFFILESEPGGTRHIFLSRFFRKNGGDVRVIAGAVNYMTGRSRLRRLRLWQNENVDGVSITWVYALPTLKYGLIGKVICYLSFFFTALPFALKEKADVMIATSPPPTVAALGWIVRKLKGIPWVFEIRDLWPEMVADLGINAGIFTRILASCMNFFYAQADYLVPLTLGFRRKLIEKGIPPEKIRTITNGVDPIFLDDNPPPPKSPAEFPEKLPAKFRVMYLGSMGIANALSPLLDAAEKLKDDSRVEFLFIGGGSEREKLIKEAAQKGLTNARFLPPVPRTAVPYLLKTADVCILTHAHTPSFQLFLPNRLFDYLAAGRPVLLCLKEGEASEILGNSGGGIRLDPGAADRIRDAILRLMENPAERQKMGESGRKYALEHFLRENLAKSYFEVLEATSK